MIGGRDMSDEDLLARVRDGDGDAFELLYERHAVSVRRVADHICRSSHQAEDVTQEAFLALWRSAASFDGRRGQPRTWLLGITRNRALDAIRRLEVRERHGHDRRPEAVPLSIPVEDEAVRRDGSLRLRSAVAQLPPDQQRALLLAYSAGLTHVEAAAALGVATGTVKSRLRLAVTRLRTDRALLDALPGAPAPDQRRAAL
jgi:RNA polymerase sigma-70 factor (ECF subfamily)